MAQYLIEDTELTAIADKLREKSGKTDEIKGSDFVSEIDNLEKINNSEIVKAIAQDKIQIGDTVYTIDKSPYNLEVDPYLPSLSGYVYSASFSPDENLLVLGGYFSGRAKVYSINGTNITYVSDIYADNNNTALNSTVYSIAFSPDGKTLILGGQFTGNAKIYSVNGTAITYVSDIYANDGTTKLNGIVETVTFSPDGNTLVLGGHFSKYAKIYSVNNTNITYMNDIYADNNNTALSNYVYSAAFSSNGNTLVLGGLFSGNVKIYSINGTTMTYISDIYADSNNTALNSAVYSVTFSPNGKLLILCGGFLGRAKIYSVNDTNITYVSNIYADNNNTALNSTGYSAAFSPDGNTLVLSGQFSGRAKIYSVNDTNITYVSNIYADNDSTTLSNTVYSVAFSPDGKALILGGNFTHYAKIYSVNTANIMHMSDIYSDNETTYLNDDVNSGVFSPDGNILVIGGSFTGGVKIYSVNGTNITYVSDIYDDDNNTAFSSIYDISFSPDGKALILCGGINRAQIYSVNGTNITYVNKIYADSNNITLGSHALSASFSPDGKLLVLGGQFSGYAKVYSVNGTNITYISDIYADNSNTTLGGIINIVAFSPDGKTLVLGGGFSGRAKVYSVNETNITYISDIYADNNSTTLSSTVNSVSFSFDGKLLALGGEFTGKAKIYSINGTNIIYVSDIYADNGTTKLNMHVNSITFSPDGKTLVVGGDFSRYAKVYSVSGTTITYISDIYANNNNTALDYYVESATFSPDGKLLVLGGQFNGFATAYQINDTTIHYRDIGYPVPNGNFTSLPFGSKLGFAKNAGEIGEEVIIKTIGEVAVDYNIDIELTTQDDLIAQISTTLDSKIAPSGEKQS